MQIREQTRGQAHRMRPVAAIAIGLAALAAVASTATAAQQAGDLGLTGTPVVLDSNIGQGAGKHHFNPLVQVHSTFSDIQNVKVEFDVIQGGKLLKKVTTTAGIRPGGGVVSADVGLPAKGTYSVKTRFLGFAPAFADRALEAARIVGAPRLVPDPPRGCALRTQVQNPSASTLSGFTSVDLIALRGGKVVAFGTAPLFDDLKAGGTAKISIDFVTCAKADEVRAYVEGDGM